MHRRPLALIIAIAAQGLIAIDLGAQTALPSTNTGEWPTYGGDLANTRYAPLDQIDASNFDELEIAWRFKTDNLGPRPEFKLEGTPLMVGDVLYATAGTRRSVVALDADTGELLWVHGEREGERAAAAPRLLSGRGLSYWTDGPRRNQERILYVTIGFQLVALDARTGQRIPDFGSSGSVDLKAAATYGEGRSIDEPLVGAESCKGMDGVCRIANQRNPMTDISFRVAVNQCKPLPMTD